MDIHSFDTRSESCGFIFKKHFYIERILRELWL